MRHHEIEAWALNVVARVKSGQLVEDSRIELKSEWVDPTRAGRRLAGHANAARGGEIMWLVGVDEKKGVVGVQHGEFAEWYAKVEAQFDGLPPSVTSLNIPVDDKTVMALLFETDRAPFVVKNPAYGERRGEHVSLEVPWREATAVRSATRAELLTILSPLQAVPRFEVLAASLAVFPWHDGNESGWIWRMSMVLYASYSGDRAAYIPYHRCRVKATVPRLVERVTFKEPSLQPHAVSVDELSQGMADRPIRASNGQLEVRGPGEVLLAAYGDSTVLDSSDRPCPPIAQVVAHLHVEDTERWVSVEANLQAGKPSGNEAYRWGFQRPPER